MSASAHASARHQAQELPAVVAEVAMPILIGSLLGGTCGLLIWMSALVRFGVTGWPW